MCWLTQCSVWGSNSAPHSVISSCWDLVDEVKIKAARWQQSCLIWDKSHRDTRGNIQAIAKKEKKKKKDTLHKLCSLCNLQTHTHTHTLFYIFFASIRIHSHKNTNTSPCCFFLIFFIHVYFSVLPSSATVHRHCNCSENMALQMLLRVIYYNFKWGRATGDFAAFIIKLLHKWLRASLILKHHSSCWNKTHSERHTVKEGIGAKGVNLPSAGRVRCFLFLKRDKRDGVRCDTKLCQSHFNKCQGSTRRTEEIKV